MKKHSLIITLVLILISSALQAKIMTVLVQPFANDGSAQYAWLSSGMTSTVVSDLGTFRDIRVVTDNDRKRVMSELELSQTGIMDEASIKKVGKMLGADLILTGNFMVNSGKMRVNARIVNAETGQIERTLKVDGTLDGIFDLQDKIVLGLMDNAGTIKLAGVENPKTDAAEKKKLEMKPRPTLSAYEFYSKGLDLRDTNPAESLDNFDKAIAIDPSYADAFLQAGYVAGSLMSRFDKGLAYLKKDDEILKKRGETKNQSYAELMMNIGLVSWSKGDLDNAIVYDTKAKDIFDSLKLQNTHDYSNLMMNFGIVYWNKGSLDKALDYYIKSKDINDSLGLQKDEDYGNLLMNIGIVYWSKGDMDRALDYYLKSKTIRDDKSLQNSNTYSLLMMNIGLVYYGKGDYDKALEYHFKSKEIREALDLTDTYDYGKCLNNIGIAYWGKGDTDKALEYYNRTKDLYDHLNLTRTSDYANIVMNLGIIYWNKNEYDRSLENYLKSKEINDSIGLQNTADYANLMMNIGLLYMAKKDYDNSLVYYGKSKTLSDSLNLQKTMSYGHLMYNFGMVYEYKDDPKTAGQYYRRAFNAYTAAGYSGAWKDNAKANAERLGQ